MPKATTSVFLHLEPKGLQYIPSKGDYGYTDFDVSKMTKQRPGRSGVKAGTVVVQVKLSIDPSVFNNVVNVAIELNEGHFQPIVEVEAVPGTEEDLPNAE